MSSVKELKRQFEKGAPPAKIVDKVLKKDQGSYLFGGKTRESQDTKTPLVVVAKAGNYSMVCDGEACYIRVPHAEGAKAMTNTGLEPEHHRSMDASSSKNSNSSPAPSRSSSQRSSNSSRSGRSLSSR